MSFSDFELDERLLSSLADAGLSVPTPIQSEAMPEIIKGSDIRASAQTGTGKTVAFLLPSLHRILTTPPRPGHGARILILVPTRELAMQVADQAQKYSAHLPKVKTVCIYGGAPYPVQKKQLARPYEILVATPGRLIDHIEQGRINLSRVDMLILDEADRMLDMGFIEPVEQIAAACPEDRQTLLFSATLKGPVMHLSERLMRQPKEIRIAATQENTDLIQQQIYFADNLQHKHQLVSEILKDESIKQLLIFTATKSYADELSEQLLEEGHAVGALHGDMNQRQRAKTLSRLRTGAINILVATDVAARGIDVSTITHVINFDLPRCVEDYTHRIGRTGRAGAKGVAISLVTPKERATLRQIELFIKYKIPVSEIEGCEPTIKDEPRKQRTRFNDAGPRSGRGAGFGRADFGRARQSSGGGRRGERDHREWTPPKREKQAEFRPMRSAPRPAQDDTFIEDSFDIPTRPEFVESTAGARRSRSTSRFAARSSESEQGERRQSESSPRRSESPSKNRREFGSSNRDKPAFDRNRERPAFERGSDRDTGRKFAGSERKFGNSERKFDGQKREGKPGFGGGKSGFGGGKPSFGGNRSKDSSRSSGASSSKRRFSFGSG